MFAVFCEDNHGGIVDTKISNGGPAIGGNGLPETVTGLNEALQQAWLCLAVPKGSFIYDRNFGSRISAEPEASEERLLVLADEAMLGRCGSRAVSCLVNGAEAEFTVITPFGEGSVALERAQN